LQGTRTDRYVDDQQHLVPELVHLHV
jgi:hypothetical protein